MLVSFHICCLVLLRFLPGDHAQFLALPTRQDKLERRKMFRGWSAWLERRPVAPALLSRGSWAGSWLGSSAAWKWKDKRETVAVRETPAEHKEKNFSLRVVKRWNGLWEVLEPSSLETIGTWLGKDLNSHFISRLQWQWLELCVLSLNNLLFCYIVNPMLCFLIKSKYFLIYLCQERTPIWSFLLKNWENRIRFTKKHFLCRS